MIKSYFPDFPFVLFAMNTDGEKMKIWVSDAYTTLLKNQLDGEYNSQTKASLTSSHFAMPSLAGRLMLRRGPFLLCNHLVVVQELVEGTNYRKRMGGCASPDAIARFRHFCL